MGGIRTVSGPHRARACAACAVALAVWLPPAAAQGRPAERADSAAPVAARVVEYRESRGANLLYFEERGGMAAPQAAAPAKPKESRPDSRRRLAAAGDGAAKR